MNYQCFYMFIMQYLFINVMILLFIFLFHFVRCKFLPIIIKSKLNMSPAGSIRNSII
ncbi:hypothetical protein MtrunA17_Chr7g0260391 [Medicago truncatula]|uniref:Transmembrane protein n=1 Tax=Medicago truncatula TaxID=3880 RepID=A0A396H5V3_MEDTR|nr:hypothetical protein MtrunA17_Chr7g0260391 [Medicago truncatula]